MAWRGTRDEARRNAEQKFGVTKQQESQESTIRANAQRAEAAKTARLRALRLAKEASDKEALAKAADAKTSRSRVRLPPQPEC